MATGITALFRDKPEQSATPHRDALRAHLREAQELSRQQQIAVGKSAAARSDMDASSAAASRVTALRGQIDQLLGDARYAGTALPDISVQERELLAAEKEHARLSIIARAAASASDRFRQDFDALTAKNREHQQALPALLHSAAVERMAALAAEFRQKEEALREVHARVFSCVVLADQLSRENGLGVFFGARLFGELNISRPHHDAFHRGSTDAWTAKLERDAEGLAVEKAAEELGRMLLTQGD